MSEGIKHDQDKTRFDLSVPHFEYLIAQVMTHGAKKYGDRNWEKGIDIRRLYAACRRHLHLFVEGEDMDAESGLPHLAHAAACLMMMNSLTNTQWDTRGDSIS